MQHKQRIANSCIALICTQLVFPVHADSQALAIHDLNPLLSGFELPVALPSAGVEPSHTELNVQFDIANTSLDQRAGNEHLVVDAEIHRWQLTVNHAINAQFSVMAEVPYQSVSGGSLDGFIENFHHAFGLPNGNRANWPRDRLFVSYENNGRTSYQFNRDSGSIGDATLRAGWHVDLAARHATSLWLSVKLPTGDALDLTGSGSADAALSLAASQLPTASLTSYEQISITWLGSGERMSSQQERVAWNGTAGIEWSLASQLSVLAQLDAHSRVFDSGTRLLGSSIQLSFGPRYRTTHWQTTLTMSEDLAVDTAPDVQFQLRVGYAFKRRVP